MRVNRLPIISTTLMLGLIMLWLMQFSSVLKMELSRALTKTVNSRTSSERRSNCLQKKENLHIFGRSKDELLHQKPTCSINEAMFSVNSISNPLLGDVLLVARKVFRLFEIRLMKSDPSDQQSKLLRSSKTLRRQEKKG